MSNTDRNKTFTIMTDGEYVRHGRLGVVFKKTVRQTKSINLNAQEEALSLLSPKELERLDTLGTEKKRTTRRFTKAAKATDSRKALKTLNEELQELKEHIKLLQDTIINNAEQRIFTTINTRNGQLILPLPLRKTMQLFEHLRKGSIIELSFDDDGNMRVFASSGSKQVLQKPRVHLAQRKRTL